MSVTQFPGSHPNPHRKRDLLIENLDRIDRHAIIMGRTFWLCCLVVLIPIVFNAACGA